MVMARSTTKVYSFSGPDPAIFSIGRGVHPLLLTTNPICFLQVKKKLKRK